WMTGRHQISMGGEYGHGAGKIASTWEGDGHFTFSGGAPFTGDSLADFVVGKFSNLLQGSGQYRNTRFNMVDFFVMDSYRVSKRLTLDIGLRWEPFFPYTDVNRKVVAWHPGQQSTRFINAPVDLVFAG